LWNVFYWLYTATMKIAVHKLLLLFRSLTTSIFCKSKWKMNIVNWLKLIMVLLRSTYVYAKFNFWWAYSYHKRLLLFRSLTIIDCKFKNSSETFIWQQQASEQWSSEKSQ
jgi:hypothetical protein